MTHRHILAGVALLVVSFFATTPAIAGKLSTDGNGKNKVLIITNRQEFLRTAKRLRVAVRTIKLSNRDKIKLDMLSGCRCSMAPDEFADAGAGFDQCFTKCLQKAGINFNSIAACGGICAGAAVTVNPIAIGICAACLGTGEWVVGACVMYCVWKSSSGWASEGDFAPILTKNEKHSRKRSPANSARLKLRPLVARA